MLVVHLPPANGWRGWRHRRFLRRWFPEHGMTVTHTPRDGREHPVDRPCPTCSTIESITDEIQVNGGWRLGEDAYDPETDA